MGNVGIIVLNSICVVAVACLSLLIIHFYLKERKTKMNLKKEHDRLRVSEEQYRIASNAFHLDVARYDIKNSIYYNNSSVLNEMGFSDTIENAPQSFIDAGIIAEECLGEFKEFYQKIRDGKTNPTSTISLKMPDGSFRWFHAQANLINNSDNIPYQAIIVYTDCTEQREKDAVYLKWKQSVQQKDPRSYTLFRCNLSKGASFDIMEGALLNIELNKKITTFNERTFDYASQNVFLDDYEEYMKILNSDSLLAGYYRGNRTGELEYRESLKDGSLRWIRMSYEMIQYQDSDDVEIFLMYENIDERKRRELYTQQQVENDPLTGILNRFAFRDRLENLFGISEQDVKHAIILIDIDNFKILNDSFGHSTGDQELIDIANGLSRVMDTGDFVGRLGGDEFIICLQNIPNISYVEKKASQIQSLIRKSISKEITISASLGIAIFPDNGNNFNVLYHKVDDALYIAKGSGKDTYCFYNEDDGNVIDNTERDEEKENNKDARNLIAKRRMIVIDSDLSNQDYMDKVFRDGYFIIYTRDVKTALIRIRLYGQAISAVFINIDSPEINGAYILEQLQKNKELKFIPVIIIGSIAQREMCIRLVKMGAADFALKPLDEEVLRIRANSAICKAENELLHDENSLLNMRRDLETKYKAVFENTGTVIIEYNWLSGVFSYDSAISKYIAGNYDDRPLWQILLSDMVVSSMDVSTMQNKVHQLASKTAQSSISMEVLMKTPDQQKHWFNMHAFRRLNEFNVTSKIIITFTDINEDVLADEKLRFQAQHDDLTGVYNRRTFLKKVEEEVQKNPPNSYYLVMGDIDDFKSINDRYGRQKGDELLQYTAEKLSIYASHVDMCGRLSNDNFAVLIQNGNDMELIMEECATHLYDDYPLDVRISCTTGGYLIDDPQMPADDILDKASMARDSIKEKYGSCFALYDESMLEKLQQEKEITEHMEEALTNGEFKVFYQPQFNHATGVIVGVEALARWESRNRGMIFPGKFIPIFEKNGFITKFDEYIWNMAAENLHEWIARGYEPVPVSVNVSREDMNDPLLTNKLLYIVKKNSIPIQLFRLEITESIFIKDTEKMIEVIDGLRKLGFLIEMDDFGSGYSSLNILKDVAVDVLKLDMRFFEGENNERGGAILNAIMRMSRWLKMPVIAEGVETKEQADFLLSLGCQTIQGYLYAKPMTRDKFEKYIIENRKRAEDITEDIKSILEMKSFWDLKSTDSQLFNHYIGAAAAVFECWNGEYEIIRVNRKFIDVMELKSDYVLPAHGLINFDETSRKSFDEAVQNVVRTEKDCNVDVKVISPKDGEKMLLHTTLRILAKSKDRQLFFVTVEKTE